MGWRSDTFNSVVVKLEPASESWERLVKTDLVLGSEYSEYSETLVLRVFSGSGMEPQKWHV